MKNTIGDAFDVKIGVYKGSVISPLLFIIVMKALSKELITSLPMELLYADDLALIAGAIRDLECQYVAWKGAWK